MRTLRTIVLLAFGFAIGLSNLAAAEERVTAAELRALVVGKKLQDVNRSDHWVEVRKDGSGAVGSRGRTVDLTYEIKEGGQWCRHIPKARRNQRACQFVAVDNGVLVFRNTDGSIASRMRVVE